jgi:hypothetical protein
LPSEADGGPVTGERRRRDALLLELGALVYELHRRGRRAPELLQEKAAELDAVETGPEPRGPAVCTNCGEPAEPGQLVCLKCGERLSLQAAGERGSRLPLLAALVGVAVLAAGVAGFVLNELTSDSGGGGAQVAERQAEPELAPETETEPTRSEPEASAAPETAPRAEGNPQPAKHSLLLEWPRDLTAHTVVLLNSSDRAAARRLALRAARSGIETGLLRSDDFDLGTGLWIVFAGRFDTRRGAERQAQNLSGRYPGAYVLRVEGSSQ